MDDESRQPLLKNAGDGHYDASINGTPHSSHYFPEDGGEFIGSVTHSSHFPEDGGKFTGSVARSRKSVQETDATEADSDVVKPRPFSVVRARWVVTWAMFLYAMGTIPSTSVMSQYLVHRWSQDENVTETSNQRDCSTNHSDPIQIQQDAIEARASTAVLYYSYAMSIPATVVCVLMGSYSDVIGRRKIFLMPLVGTSIKYTLHFLIIKYRWHTNYFFIGNVFEGMGGAFHIMLVASFAITADLNEDKSNRVFWINMLLCFNQAVSAAFVVGLGYIIQYLGFKLVYAILAIPVVAGFILAFFFLPETRPSIEDKSLNFLVNIGRIVKLYASEGSRRDRLSLILAMVLFFFGSISVLTVSAVDTLYQLHAPLCWQATQIAYYLAVAQGGTAIVGVIYLTIAQRIGCISDEIIAMVGMLFQGAGYVLEAFVKNTLMMYMVPVLIFPSFPSVGIIRGTMSLLAGPNNQGALFASISMAEAICYIVSSTSFFQMYAATVDTMPGAAYFLMAALCFLNFFLFFPFFHYYKDSSKNKNFEKVVEIEED